MVFPLYFSHLLFFLLFSSIFSIFAQNWRLFFEFRRKNQIFLSTLDEATIFHLHQWFFFSLFRIFFPVFLNFLQFLEKIENNLLSFWKKRRIYFNFGWINSFSFSISFTNVFYSSFIMVFLLYFPQFFLFGGGDKCQELLEISHLLQWLFPSILLHWTMNLSTICLNRCWGGFSDLQIRDINTIVMNA